VRYTSGARVAGWHRAGVRDVQTGSDGAGHMTSRDFAFWLQGYFELCAPDSAITARQAECIRKHLAMVFVHEIDPSMGTKEHQAKLDAEHQGPKPGPTSGSGSGHPTVYRC
jgi:hypothetical protein